MATFANTNTNQFVKMTGNMMKIAELAPKQHTPVKLVTSNKMVNAFLFSISDDHTSRGP